MPRSIIDTESSRGRLVRRRIVAVAFITLAVLALALLVAVRQGLLHAH